mmetsp:Transcript_2242/g.6692  ORF Transcript_2242/g.6692 Transcript_2242/m.6692 type:complete len:293 (-) Transcript_2242:1055-1933(-)
MSEVESFLEEFQASLEDLKASLEACTKELGEKSGRVAVLSLIDDGVKRLETLDGRLSSASLFLPSYEVRRCASDVGKLRASYRSRKRALFPREQFRFRNLDKVLSGQSSEQSTSTTIAASQDGPPKNAEKCDTAEKNSDENLVVSHRVGETVTVENNGGKHVVLSHIQGCTVMIRSVSGALHMEDVADSHVSADPVRGSIHISRCSSSQFELSARQVRIHDSSGSTFFLHTQSGAIIESCTNLKFAPLDTENVREKLVDAELSSSVNEWDKVRDFNWLRVQPSPNWRKCANA